VAPNASAPGFTTELYKIRTDAYGAATFGQGAAEYRELLWTHYHNSTGAAEVDTGYIDTDSWSHPFSHLTIEVPNAPTGTAGTIILRVKAFYLRWDDYGDAGASYPSVGSLSSEGGVGAGLFPVNVNIQNISDSAQTSAFTVTGRMEDEQAATIDCQAHSVSGALGLTDVSYQKSTWLRLVPGSNTIRFSSSAGTGQFQATLTWRNRY
jgi:hypothetical protein